MSYGLFIIKNNNFTNRSLNHHQQGNLFSVRIGTPSYDFLSEANKGTLYDISYGIRAGTRTLPLANDPNWEISAVFQFKYLREARHAASLIRSYTNSPRIVRSVRKEIELVENTRYNPRHNNLDWHRIGWNNLKSIRHLPGMSIQDLNQFVSVELAKHDIDFRRLSH